MGLPKAGDATARSSAYVEGLTSVVGHTGRAGIAAGGAANAGSSAPDRVKRVRVHRTAATRLRVDANLFTMRIHWRRAP
jgi:hypothetical protein